MWLATYHMSGVAHLWYMRVERMDGMPNWRHFTDLVNRRFGTPTCHNPLGALMGLRRTALVAEFTENILTLQARCGHLNGEQHVMLFTAGLGEPLQTHVELQRPTDLEVAMDLA